MANRQRSRGPPGYVDWSTVDQRTRQKTWVKVNEPDKPEFWVYRWTSKELERNPKCLDQLLERTAPEKRNPHSTRIDWTPGSPHHAVSMFLTYHTRGGNKRVNKLADSEGYIDIDQIMYHYIY